MSTATLPTARVRPSSKLLSAAELADLPDQINGSDVKYELYDGRLVIMAPPGGEHSRRQYRIVHFLHDAESAGLGAGFVEIGIVLRRDPDTVVGADAAFVLKQSLPVKHSREGYLETIPEIIVEVKSKNDTVPEIRSKCEDYFEAGVKVVWRVDPKTQTLLAVYNDGREQSFGIADTLTCELLPGFAVPLSVLFD